MKNSYYCITLPNALNKARFTGFLALGKKEGLPHQLLHYRMSLDGTKVLIQGDIPSNLASHISGKVFIEYLGDCLPNGQAEKKVHDWLEKNRVEWENEVI